MFPFNQAHLPGVFNWQLPNSSLPQGWAIAHSHIFALFKSAIVQLHFLSLFSKVQLCNRTFCRSSQSVMVQSHFFVALFKKVQSQIALLKRANVPKCAKKGKFSNRTFLLF